MAIPCAVVTRGDDGSPTVTVRGDIDFRNSEWITGAVQLAARLPGEVIVLDLGELTFIDSSGISALVRAARWLCEQGRALRLKRAKRHVTQLLRTAGFTRYFIFDPEEAWSAPPAHLKPGMAKHWQHTSFSIPARFGLIAYVRRCITEMVESVPGAEEHLDGIRLAVGEAASNAVRHGCAANEGLKVGVECSTDGANLVVEITDPGPGFDPGTVPTPLAGELREGGMGIHFMRLTMDDVRYRFDDRGTTVRLRKCLLPSDPEPPSESTWEPSEVP